MFLTDKQNIANLVDYARIKSLRVERSFIGVEILELACASENTTLIQHDLHIILKKKVKIKNLTHSAKIFNIMIRNAPTTEKRLMIYINASGEDQNDDIIVRII